MTSSRQEMHSAGSDSDEGERRVRATSVSRGSEDSAGGNRLEDGALPLSARRPTRQRPPFTDEVSASPFTPTSELLQHAGRERARIGLAWTRFRLRCRMPTAAKRARPTSRSRGPRGIIEAEAQRRAAVVRIPPRSAAPADERPVGDTIHGSRARCPPVPSAGKP